MVSSFSPIVVGSCGKVRNWWKSYKNLSFLGIFCGPSSAIALFGRKIYFLPLFRSGDHLTSCSITYSCLRILFFHLPLWLWKVRFSNLFFIVNQFLFWYLSISTIFLYFKSQELIVLGLGDFSPPSVWSVGAVKTFFVLCCPLLTEHLFLCVFSFNFVHFWDIFG